MDSKALFLAILICSSNFFAQAMETSEAFLVTIYNDRVKVVSPKKHDKNLSVIFDNQTLGKVIGKVQVPGKVITYIALDPRKKKSVDIVVAPNAALEFVSMAPAFQEVKLLVGKSSYEIPEKK